MVVIDKDSVISNSWQTIYNVLNGNLTYPKPPPIPTKWVFGSYPDYEAKDFPGWPIVVIESPNPSLNHLSLGRKTYQWPISIKISVFGNYSEHIDSIADEILKLLRVNETSIASDGLGKFNVGSSGIQPFDLNGNRIYAKTINISFEFVDKVV